MVGLSKGLGCLGILIVQGWVIHKPARVKVGFPGSVSLQQIAAVVQHLRGIRQRSRAIRQRSRQWLPRMLQARDAPSSASSGTDELGTTGDEVSRSVERSLSANSYYAYMRTRVRGG